MRAVNLIPPESRRTARSGGDAVGPGHLVVGVLAIAIAFVVAAVLTANTVSARRAQLATLRAEVAQARAEAGRLADFTSYEQMAQQRIGTVEAIAASRFDWRRALVAMSSVVPSDTSFQSLNASVAPGAGSGGGSSLRGDIAAPAFEITGCTSTQDEVARLMSRLRLIGGVTRVALQSSQKSNAATPATSASTGGAGGCAAGSPTFDLVVFFTPLPSAGPDGVTSLAAAGPGGAR